MRFDLDRPSTAHVIRSYAPGALRVGERTYDSSVIVSRSELLAPWRPRTVADLRAEDLEPVLALRPEVLLIGTGPRQVFPERALLAPLYAARIGYEVMDTAAACRTYNVLVGEGREVAAALIVD
jgi:uncharacterized protein